MAETFSTSVHPQETSALPPFSSTFQQHLTSPLGSVWLEARQLYSFLDDKHTASRLDKLDHCRSFAWFARNKATGLVRILSNTCKLRWCPLCCTSLSHYITHQAIAWLDTAKSPKFLTFTLRHSDNALSDQIDALYRFFRRIRGQNLLKRKINGGIWFFQIKYNPETNQYHPHIHCLIDSLFIPHHALSSMWAHITQDSKIVDIRAVHNRKSAARYVARYCASPANLSAMPFPNRVEIAESLHGRRICGTWGTARSVKLRVRPPESKHEWENIGTWWTVTRMLPLDDRAQQIISSWQTHTPLPPDVSMSPEDDFLDDYQAPNIQLHTTPRAQSPPLLWT